MMTPPVEMPAPTRYCPTASAPDETALTVSVVPEFDPDDLRPSAERRDAGIEPARVDRRPDPGALAAIGTREGVQDRSLDQRQRIGRNRGAVGDRDCEEDGY